jgi:hypothetical protein
MTASQSLKIYETLNKHFNNPEDAKLVCEQIEQIVDDKLESKKEAFLTKDDKADIIASMHRTKMELIKWFAAAAVIEFIFTLLS